MDAELRRDIFSCIALGASNAATARKIGCDRRTVRRYRRIGRLLDLTPSVAATMPSHEIGYVFNARMPRTEHPKFDDLDREFPQTSARFKYERYRERTADAPKRCVSLSQFNRLRVEHEFAHDESAWFTPGMSRFDSSAHSGRLQ